MGVGTDQNYLIAGWSRPEVLVLMDFDQVVVDLHRVYQLAFLHAESPEAFLRLSAEAFPAARVAARRSGDVMRHRWQT